MNPLPSSVGRAQLGRPPEPVMATRKAAECYRGVLGGIEGGLGLPSEPRLREACAVVAGHTIVAPAGPAPNSRNVGDARATDMA